MSDRCASPLQETSLVDYWLSELDAPESELIEAHLFECAACSARLRAVVRVVDAVRHLMRTLPPFIVSRSELQNMRRRGVRILQAELAPFATLKTRVPDDVDICVIQVALDLQAVERVLIEYCKADGTPFVTVRNVPFYPESNEVLLACERHVAAGHSAVRMRVIDDSDDSHRALVDCLIINADEPAADGG